MTDSNSRSMAKWLFRDSHWVNRLPSLGVMGVCFVAFATSMIDNLVKAGGLVPDTWITPLTCVILAGALLFPIVKKCIASKEVDDFEKAISFLGLGFLFIALNYLAMLISGDEGFISGLPLYDPITEMIGSFCFIATWFFSARSKLSTSEVNLESLTIVISFILFAIFIFWKNHLHNDVNRESLSNDISSLRLITNMFNCIIWMGVYLTFRRFYARPDPISHLLILFAGAGQAVSHGRDCTRGDSTPCELPSAEAFVAVNLEWILLLGKVCLGLYALYLLAMHQEGDAKKIELNGK